MTKDTIALLLTKQDVREILGAMNMAENEGAGFDEGLKEKLKAIFLTLEGRAYDTFKDRGW